MIKYIYILQPDGVYCDEGDGPKKISTDVLNSAYEGAMAGGSIALTPPPDPLYSKTEAAALGLKPKAGAVPAALRKFKWGQYPCYRREDLEPKRVIVKREAVSVDLLAAIFTVNRTAKRYRDAAAKHYSRAQYGFATNAREVKERMYALKDRGMVYAARRALLKVSGVHGVLTYYEGGGYRFHSLLRPVGCQAPVLGEDMVQVEAKPKGRREVRLLDAEYTIDLLPPLDIAGFERHHFPPRHRARPRWRDEEDLCEEDEYRE